jgi:hypothetical protein
MTCMKISQVRFKYSTIVNLLLGFLTIEEGAAEENSPIAEDVSAEEKSREENSEKENIETIKEEEGMEDKEKPTGVEKSIDDENEESIVESERWIDECANVGNGNTEKIAECVTEFATQNKSFKLLGCVVTCSITSWSNATGFLNCLQHCIRQPNYQHDPNQNKTSPIKPSIKIAGIIIFLFYKSSQVRKSFLKIKTVFQYFGPYSF